MVVIINLQQEVRKRADTQIVDAKQLEVKVNIFKYYHLRLMAHSKQFHNVGVQKSIEKSYFFEEKFLLVLVKDMQHFLDSYCFDISLSFIFCSIHIAKSTLTEPLLNLQSVTIKDFLCFQELGELEMPKKRHSQRRDACESDNVIFQGKSNSCITW